MQMETASVDELKAYYEEQLASQRGMLTTAIDSLTKKREELEKALDDVNKRNYELNQISHRTFHDMKEPMVSLLGLVKVIREENASESVGYLLDLAEASIKRLNNFSLSLADYVALVQKQPDIQSFDFEDLLESLIDSLKELEGFDKVRFEIVNKSERCCIRHDWDTVTALIKQPIINAIRYRDVDKSPFVSLAYKVKDDRVILSVEDNGMGMSASVHEKVMGMFYRGSNKSTGFGLGLYMTKTLLEMYGGNYRIASKEGQGTSVFLSIALQNQESIAS